MSNNTDAMPDTVQPTVLFYTTLLLFNSAIVANAQLNALLNPLPIPFQTEPILAQSDTPSLMPISTDTPTMSHPLSAGLILTIRCVSGNKLPIASLVSLFGPNNN